MFGKSALRSAVRLGAAAALVMSAVIADATAQDNPLIGELGGPTVVTDANAFPTSFQEAPMLAEKVAAGQLPPVEERLPIREDLLVLEPLEAIGTYGGAWRRAFTGPGDAENGARINASDKLLFSDYTGTQTMPSIAKGITVNEDGTRFTLELREGLKWSDGHPFTADDIIWWYENVWLNTEITSSPTADLSINGEQGRIEKVDDYTVAYVFPSPYYLFEEMLRGDTFIGGGLARYASNRNGMGGYAPAHYMQQFHASFAPEEELQAMVAEEGHESWVELYMAKNHFGLNPDLPVLGPWRTVQPINTQAWVLERNPYYHVVDSAGNQLPYIDRIEMSLSEDLEVLNLRAIAGEYDFQSRHLLVDKLPAFIENQEKGNYTVRLNPGPAGAAAVNFNMAYDADPEIQKWFNTADFRRALSLAIDREQINEVFFLGLGTPGSNVVSEEHPHNPGPEWRLKWSEHDPEKANQMLDAIGLTGRDAEGFRLRTDNGERLRVEILTTAGAFQDFTGMAEMVAGDWKEVGIQADIVEVEQSLRETRRNANENQIELFEATGTESIWTNPQNMMPANVATRLGVPFARWYVSNGAEGVAPTDPELLRAFELYRSAPGLPEAERDEVARELWQISLDQQWAVGLVGLAPGSYGVMVATNRLGNVPERLSINRQARVPGSAWPPMFYFRE